MKYLVIIYFKNNLEFLLIKQFYFTQDKYNNKKNDKYDIYVSFS